MAHSRAVELGRRAPARGFSIIELLVVLVVVGVLAAIAIPGLLNGRERSLQKRTMADLRGLGVAVESYGVDAEAPPPVFGVDLAAASVLTAYLVPTYIAAVPADDAWKQPVRWTAGVASGYTIASWGKDGVHDAAAALGATTSFAADIYYSNGNFTAWPDGTQN